MAQGEGGQDAVLPGGTPGEISGVSVPPQSAETPKSDEELRREKPIKYLNLLPSVSAEGGRLGRLLILPGQTVNLADIFPEGKETYPEVYFRTRDNIYRLTRDVTERGVALKIASAKEQPTVGGVRLARENSVYLQPELESGSKITINKGFGWDKGSTYTSKITEAVIVEPGVISDQDRLTHLPKNSIVEDFKAMSQVTAEQAPQGK